MKKRILSALRGIGKDKKIIENAEKIKKGIYQHTREGLDKRFTI